MRRYETIEPNPNIDDRIQARTKDSPRRESSFLDRAFCPMWPGWTWPPLDIAFSDCYYCSQAGDVIGDPMFFSASASVQRYFRQMMPPIMFSSADFDYALDTPARLSYR